MYSKEFEASLQAVEAARKENIAYEPARMTAKEKEELLAAYHPDYKKSEFATLQIGPNKGEQVPHELCEILQAKSRISADQIDLSRVEAPYTMTIDGPGGFSNTITVEKGRICVSKAGCPDQICVHQGYISDGTTPIVCLPNKLIIEIIGGGSGLDAATG